MRTRWKRALENVPNAHIVRWWWVYGCARERASIWRQTNDQQTKTIEQIKSGDEMRGSTWFVFAFLINATIKYRPWPWAGCQQLISAAHEIQPKKRAANVKQWSRTHSIFARFAFAVYCCATISIRCEIGDVRDLCEMKFHDLLTQHVTPDHSSNAFLSCLALFCGTFCNLQFFHWLIEGLSTQLNFVVGSLFRICR